MTSIPPGWYPDPENPDRQRYWNGTRWTDDVSGEVTGGFPPPPPPSYGATPPPGGWAQPVGAFSRKSQAGLALGFSIGGMLCCGPLTIVGLVMGRTEIGAIDRGETDPTKRGLATAAFVVGVVGVAIWSLLLFLQIALS